MLYKEKKEKEIDRKNENEDKKICLEVMLMKRMLFLCFKN